jgi:hypothetical protein
MKNSYKIAAVSAACAVAVMAFGAIVSEKIQEHGGQMHGGQMHEHMAALHVEMSGFQMALTHIVDREYTMMSDGADAGKLKQIHESQHKAMMAIFTPAQQEAAIKEMVKQHPDMAGKMQPGKSMVKTLAVATPAQQEQLKKLHETIQSHMSGFTEEEVAAIHAGKAGPEAEAHLQAMVAEIRGLLSADQGKEWDAVIAFVAAEKRRLGSP